MSTFMATVKRLVRALFRTGDRNPPTLPESPELHLERELRRGMRGD